MSYRGKVILLGDPGVGKTSLLARFVDGIFRSEYVQTIGANFLIKEIDLENIIDQLRFNSEVKNKIMTKGLKLFLWDIGGQQDKLFVSEYYFIDAVGAMVVFNLVNKETFDNLEFWITKLKKLSGDIPFVLVGNKKDLKDKRLISKEDIESIANEYEVKYFETSAKLNESVNSAFEELSIQILNNLK